LKDDNLHFQVICTKCMFIKLAYLATNNDTNVTASAYVTVLSLGDTYSS